MNTTGKIERALTFDETILELDQKFFPNPWGEKEWRELDPQHHFIFRWEIQDKTEGFALFSIAPGDDTAHLYKILLHPAKRGTGEASFFWSAIVGELKSLGASKVYLEVEANNLSAVGFYKKVGFTCLRRVKSFYSHGEDALILQLTL